MNGLVDWWNNKTVLIITPLKTFFLTKMLSLWCQHFKCKYWLFLIVLNEIKLSIIVIWAVGWSNIWIVRHIKFDGQPLAILKKFSRAATNSYFGHYWSVSWLIHLVFSFWKVKKQKMVLFIKQPITQITLIYYLKWHREAANPYI